MIQRYAIIAGVVLALVVLAFLYGVSTDKVRERDKWIAAELEGERARAAVIEQLRDRNRELESATAAAIAAAESEKQEARRLADEIESISTQISTVQVRTIEVPANCPVVSCPVVDIGLDYRLHNCSIDPGACDLRDTDETDISDDTVPIIENAGAVH